MSSTEIRTNSSPELQTQAALFSRNRLLLPLTLVLGLAVGGSSLAFLINQNHSRIVLADAEMSTPTPTLTKPVVRAYHITNNPNYCQDTVRPYRQSQAVETGCQTPTPMEAQKVNKPSEKANDHTQWGLATDEEEGVVSAMITPTIILPTEVLPHPTPTIQQLNAEPLPPHLQCERFPLDDDWAHECRRIRGY
jgi:hypothetical protein